MRTSDLLPKLGDVYMQVNRLLAHANELVSPELQRSGGYLTITDEKTGKVLLILACGIIPIEKNEKYLKFSQEKANRVFKHKKHKTSYESKNEENLMFPGAIRGAEGIYSFSGHQPDVDEAIAVSVFSMFEPIQTKHLDYYGEDLFDYYFNHVSSRNKFIEPFLESSKSLVNNNWLQYFG